MCFRNLEMTSRFFCSSIKYIFLKSGFIAGEAMKCCFLVVTEKYVISKICDTSWVGSYKKFLPLFS